MKEPGPNILFESHVITKIDMVDMSKVVHLLLNLTLNLQSLSFVTNVLLDTGKIFFLGRLSVLILTFMSMQFAILQRRLSVDNQVLLGRTS